MARNLYDEVAARILEQLKQGVVPWRQPWSASKTGTGNMPRNAITGRAYSGSNVILLWSQALTHGYGSRWLTYKQAIEAGGNVRKGEKGTSVVYIGTFDVKDKVTDKDKRIPYLKGYTVFNLSQCEGLDKLSVEKVLPPSGNERNELAEAFVATTGVRLQFGGSKAYYSPATDHVGMPSFDSFKSSDAYYSTLFHEIVHWTSNPKRLDRELGKRFGDISYSVEELIAELGSAFLCAEFCFDNNGQDASYIAHWIKFLTDHGRAFVSAASAASKACDYLRGMALAETDEIEVAA